MESTPTGQAIAQRTPTSDKGIRSQINSCIVRAVHELQETKRLNGRWLTAQVLCEVIKARYNFIGELDFDTKHLNAVISKNFGMADSVATDGLLRVARRVGQVRWTVYAMVEPGDTKPPLPNEDGEVMDWPDFIEVANDMNRFRYFKRSSKRRRIQTDLDIKIRTLLSEITVMEQTNAEDLPQPMHFQFESNFASTETPQLFNVGAGEIVEEVLDRRIEKLLMCINTLDGYKRILPAGEGDTNYVYSEFDKMILRHNSQCLVAAYKTALASENNFSWRAVCEKARESVSLSGIDRTGSVKKIQELNREFREHECFRHSNYNAVVGEQKLPTMFEVFPEALGRLITWAAAHLKEFSIESVQKYINETLIKDLLGGFNETCLDDEEPLTLLEFCESILGLKGQGISRSTVVKYLQLIGFSYKPRSKTFYVDGHEREDVVKDRINYCYNYLSLELRAHRWVQVDPSTAELKKLVEEKIICPEEAHSYTTTEGKSMWEFHVDTAKELLEFVTGEVNIQRGGNLSVRKPANTKTVIMIGQDEACFQQNALRRNQWQTPDGHQELLPKTDGETEMVSMFVNREDGLLPWNQEFVDRVNQNRQGTDYLSTRAAQDLLQTTKKADLSVDDSPMIQTFGIGINNEGYWNYDQMSLQFEDVNDCYMTAYPPDKYKLVYFFDHSSCHDRMLPDGLSVPKMNIGFGGAQPNMRNTKVTQIGIHKAMVEQDQEQSLVFLEGDYGPFWRSKSVNEATKHDKHTGKKKTRSLTKAEIFKRLYQENVSLPRKWLSSEEVREIASSNNIAVEVTEDVIKEGWMGKPKGMKQVLWERGFLDPDNLKRYTEKGPVVDGEVDLEYSYVAIMKSQPDFKNEMSALQHLGRKLGVDIKCSPKYHAECAGEGIEYVWAICKGWFKRLPLSARKSRNSFKKCVARAVSPEVISKKTVRGAGRRSRSYMLAYLCLEETGSEALVHQKFVDIEVTAKICRSHRGPGDQQAKFIRRFYEEIVNNA